MFKPGAEQTGDGANFEFDSLTLGDFGPEERWRAQTSFEQKEEKINKYQHDEPSGYWLAPLQFDIWNREPISVRSHPPGSHCNKLLVFEWPLAGS